jgi:hypothetical protein
MMNCKQATRLMSEELDRGLTWRERIALKMHVMMCAGCTNFRKQMAFLRRASRFWSGNRG